MSRYPCGDSRRALAWLPRAVRLVVIFAGTLVLLAIVVASLAGHRPSAAVMVAAAPLFRVPSAAIASDLFLNAEGVPVAVAHPGEYAMLRAGWARPGRAEVVGVLCPLAGRGGPVLLARLAQPSGEVFGQIPVDELPNWWGAPCWYPDGSARVLLAGTDDGLMSVAFAEDRGGAPRVSAVAWNAGPPGGEPDQIHDLTWPSGDALGGLILASFMTRKGPPGWEARDQYRAWWIRLGEAGAEVVDAAPLIRRGSPAPPGLEERHPVLIPRRDGPMSLAWLERDGGSAPGRWRLRAGPVEIDEDWGSPFVREEGARVLAEDCALVAPAVGEGGGRVGYVPEAPGPPRVGWVSLGSDPR